MTKAKDSLYDDFLDTEPSIGVPVGWLEALSEAIAQSGRLPGDLTPGSAEATQRLDEVKRFQQMPRTVRQVPAQIKLSITRMEDETERPLGTYSRNHYAEITTLRDRQSSVKTQNLRHLTWPLALRRQQASDGTPDHYIACNTFFRAQAVWIGGTLPRDEVTGTSVVLRPLELGSLPSGVYRVRVEYSIADIESAGEHHTFITMIDPIEVDETKILQEADDKRNYSKNQDPTSPKGRIFVPKDPKAVKGLVVVVNGALPMQNQSTFFKSGFDYLLKCLASNGFVAVAIMSTTSKEVRATQILGNIPQIVKTEAPKRGVPNLASLPLSLLGVSEAGESVAIAASKITTTDPAIFSKVDVAVLLGPTASSPASYTKGFAQSMMIVSGYHDGEQATESIKLFDDATEIGFRTYVSVQGLAHYDVCDSQHFPFEPNEVEASRVDTQGMSTKVAIRKAGNIAVQNYVTMFLLWKIAKRSEFQPVFLGDAIPTLSDPNGQVQKEIDKILTRVLYRRNDGNVESICANSSCALFQDFLVDLQPAKPKMGALNKLNSRTFTTQVGFKLTWQVTPKMTPRIFVIPGQDVLALQPPVIEFDIVETVYSTFNLVNSLTMKIAFQVLGIGANPSTFITIPRPLDIRKNQGTGVIAGFSTPTTVRILLSSLGVTAKNYPGIQAFVLDFSLDRKFGQALLIGFRHAFV